MLRIIQSTLHLMTQHGHKMCSKECATRQDFSIESKASGIMSGDVLAVEKLSNFYTIIT